MNPKLKVVAAKQGGVFSSAQAADCGYTLEQVRRRLRDGRWERVRHGQYAESVDLSRLAPWDQQRQLHRRQVHAVVNSKRPESVAVSHQSALVLHDLPLWGIGLEEVHLTRLDNFRGGLTGAVRHHRGKLAPGELTEVQGLITTTLPRAVAETACTASFEAAVVIADAAVRRPQLSAEAIGKVLDVVEFWPGSPTARKALAFADRRCESVGESRLRVLMNDQGLTAPMLQVDFEDAAGFVGRVDFYFPEHNTVVEFDGLVKYSGGSAEALIEEKRREDRLRALGVEVVRIIWSDLARPAEVAARIRQAFARAARRTA
ncbi:MAG TPA: type IV toxin-antitoxin system AbiEi family antitoxin domain-containing protein [Kribbella sp.]|uniref:type IV toxin-antitoxin system AbiEi family antitoxin domain-containing protein n=1 Tax=Kribbella sp. TaxID=1871183 RepID=UPI002D7A07BB|nr:type IV toxin-antitoxin system AbiEi family antitoxin domain-containing protein [Kribbella sp.]HET6296795.1 type IV toxin-antitoxin system AbiEi family antitoxin domain-containing protein [Kribbella sp.]